MLKRTLVNNFIVNEDYKILLIPKDEQVHGGINKENIMLNIDTFKNMCILVKTNSKRRNRTTININSFKLMRLK